MIDDFPIEGEDAGYVPCLELAAPFDAEEEGAVFGLGTGFVAIDAEAAVEPAPPREAIVGSGVGFVPAECYVVGEEFLLNRVWEVMHTRPPSPAGDPSSYETFRQTTPVNSGVGRIGHLVPPGGIPLPDPPHELYELRYFMRFVPWPGHPTPPPAIGYRISGVVRPSGNVAGLAYSWEVRHWDWQSVTVGTGLIWNEGTLVHQGTYVMPDDTVWSPGNQIGKLIEFEFPAIEPDRCWIGFRNVSTHGDAVEPDLSFTVRPVERGGESFLTSNGLYVGYLESWNCFPLHAP